MVEPYPMKWFRFYDEALNDPKVQRLPDASFKYWINLLCLANQGKPRGRFRRDQVAYALRISEERATKMLAYFMEQGLFEVEGDYLVPHGWDSRQFQSDNVTERVKQHRRNVSGNVSRPFHATPPDTETDTETEEPPKSPTGDRVLFDEFWALVVRKEPSSGKAFESWMKATEKAHPDDILAGLKRWLPVWHATEDKTKIPHITTWLNQERWTVEHPAMPSQNGAHPEAAADKRPAIKPYEPGAPKSLSPEKRAEILRMREGFGR
jgi:hypothetical protein